MTGTGRALAMIAVLGGAVGCASHAPDRAAAADAGTTPSGNPYLECCASCHGADARGRGPVAASLKMPPPDLTQLARTHGGQFPRAEVAAVVTGAHPVASHGTREMPVWALHFEPAGQAATGIAAAYAQRRLDAILDHLESVQAK
ncbi:MAG TPA: cytochrome C [Candidatus Eisenbacteria bacterium]|nr:cytochrome C [Candidatus Eisenbacteria bacterium]